MQLSVSPFVRLSVRLSACLSVRPSVFVLETKASGLSLVDQLPDLRWASAMAYLIGWPDGIGELHEL